MEKLLLIIGIALIGCSPDNECNCEKWHYKTVAVTGGIRNDFMYKEDTHCQDETIVHYASNMHYKVVCE